MLHVPGVISSNSQCLRAGVKYSHCDWAFSLQVKMGKALNTHLSKETWWVDCSLSMKGTNRAHLHFLNHLDKISLVYWEKEKAKNRLEI